MNEAFILMDRSGSMSSMWNEAIKGVNEYVEKLDDVNVKFAVFDGGGYDVVRDCHANEWQTVSTGEVTPRGATPLLDAAGRTMNEILTRKPDRAILVVITDGYENASREYTKDQVKKLTEQMGDANYEIVYLGANFDKVEEVATQTLGTYNDSYGQTKIMNTTAKGFGAAMAATAAASQCFYNEANAAFASAGSVRTRSFYSNEDKVKAAAK